MNQIDPVRVRIARVCCLAAHGLQVNRIRSRGLGRYRHLGGLNYANIVSSVGKMPIRRAKRVKFSPFLVNHISSADIHEEIDNNNKACDVQLYAISRGEAYLPDRTIEYDDTQDIPLRSNPTP